MARLLARVLPRSAHTRARPGDWRRWAPIDKAEMMASFDDLVTVPVRRDRAMEAALAAEGSRDFAPEVDGYTVGLSTGTSGRRALFLLAAAERAAWAGVILGKMLPRPWRRERIAFFLRANSRLYETLGSRRITFRYFDLERPLDALADELTRFDPTILVGPPSVLAALVGRAHPARVISVAEVLDPLDRARIERGFGAPVEQIYQATEGLLGATCRHGTLHLAEDVNAFDLIPAGDGRVIPVVSNLYRSVQPVIRYRLDDVLVLRDAPCPCGSPFTALEAIEGRADDVLRGVAPDGSERLVFGDLVSRAVLRALDVLDYEVVQTGSEVTVDVALPAPLTDDGRAALVRELLGAFARQGALPPLVRVRDGLSAATGPVKRRRVRRR